MDVLVAEVEAIHGKRFDDQPWLQQYFEERYWYAAADSYDPKKLTTIERKNIAFLSDAQKRQRQLLCCRATWSSSKTRRSPKQMLRGLSLHELRLIAKRDLCASRTHVSSAMVAAIFHSQPWYLI